MEVKAFGPQTWSFFLRNGSSLYTSGGINEAHTHTPHAACFVFKNILISLFHRELNAIDWSGPFKISTSISISSSNAHTVSFPSGNNCPWVAGSWRGLFVCGSVFCAIQSFVLSTPQYCESRYIGFFQRGYEQMQNTPSLTFIVCPSPSIAPPSPLHSSVGRYLFVFEMH